MRQLKELTSVVIACSALVGLPQASKADYLTSTTTVGAGNNWNGLYWQTNGAGTLVGTPSAGNTYALIANGTDFGNNQGNTRTRNPIVSGVQTFGGDSLTLNTNTELRMKNNGSILNFPGAGGGAPGLILNGGIINVGDDGNFPITGIIQVTAQSYLCPGNNGGGGLSANARSMDIQGQLTGSGNLVIFEASLQAAQKISGNSNAFTGQWVVMNGWLQGAGTNSLGTNSITVDPQFVLPVPPFSSTAPVLDVSSGNVPQLEVNYDLNSAGTLTMVNGGQFILHQNVCFSAVSIEGTPLSAGTHFYPDLVNQFPGNFTAGGLGSITVQPYGTPPPLAPTITGQPVAQVLYAGLQATFTVVATGHPPLTYQWRKNGANLTDGGNVSGSKTNTLVLSNISAASDNANYDVFVTSSGRSTYSSVASLTVLPLIEPYATALVAVSPAAFYEFNDTGDPATNALAFDSVGGFVGTYGAGVANGNALYNIQGPGSAEGFAGFAPGNKAAQFANGTGTSLVTLPALNFGPTTTNITITAWLNPSGTQVASEGIVFCRAGTTVAGFNYSAATDASGDYTLGYTWNNNDVLTYQWDSRLVPPLGQWSFVVLVVTPTNATIYVMNTNGLASSVFTHNHIAEAFDGATLIGDDSFDAGNGSRVFNGTIDDVAIFKAALSKDQLLGLYTTASGVSQFPPYIGTEPLSLSLYPGMAAQFTVPSSGSDPLYYQWQAGVSGSGVFTNIVDDSRITGSATPQLSYSYVTVKDSADLRLVITNAYGAITSSVATLTMLAASPPEAITMSVQEAAGQDWDTAGQWSDGNPASISAYEFPGSTYEVLVGARLRTPSLNPNAIFPGQILTVDGDGVFSNSPAAGNMTTSEIRFKQPASGNSVTFSNLVMNGGQLDLGNPGLLILAGHVTCLTNTPIYIDSGGSTGRQLQMDAQLAGGGGIEWSAFDASLSGELIITCPSNMFTGAWQVDQGLLLGTGTNSLGPNNITIAANGALWTTYNLTSPNAGLYLNGRMLLTQDDVFNSAVIGGMGLAPGTYAFTQLTNLFPANFPATWTGVGGTTNVYTGGGSLTVLQYAPPVITTQPVSLTNYPGQPASFTVSVIGGQPFTYQWKFRALGAGTFINLSDGGGISGSTNATLVISSPTAANVGDYEVAVSNPAATVTSTPASLALLPTFPPEAITLSVQQAIGEDWDTATAWSDGNPASVSAYEYPGSTYEILPNALLRTPAATVNAIFPGRILTVDGDGVYANGGSATIGEIRFKQPSSGSSVTFSNLVMNGGQFDFGNDGLVILAGKMNVAANTPIYRDTGGDANHQMQIDAQLSGAGNIEFHAFDASLTGELIINGANNTYSGTWNVVQGLLVGAAAGSLGTNNITVGANGALASAYAIVNTNGSLTLDGRMLLSQNDVFANVVINGTALAPGYYTFAQLTSLYPSNFPTMWTGVGGSSTVYTGSGSINVGNVTPPQPPNVTVYVQMAGTNVVLTWSQGILLQADTVTGPWSTNLATSPYLLAPTPPQKFYRVRVQ
jgi:hypothetical protein